MKNLRLYIAVLTSTLIVSSLGYETQECTELSLPSGILLHCPPPDEPRNTECCYDGGQPACCFIDKQDQTLVMIIALSVIITCFALTILIVVCCFCPKCLLYDACRAKYTRGEIIAYTKDEEMALNSTMPYEDQTEKSSYSPHAIKIKPIADV